MKKYFLLSGALVICGIGLALPKESVERFLHTSVFINAHEGGALISCACKKDCENSDCQQKEVREIDYSYGEIPEDKKCGCMKNHAKF